MGKNIFIITDLEGISGIDNINQIDENSENYRFSLERLMIDTNAAISGAFDGGANEVYVCDGHGGGNNFIIDMLDKRAKLVKVTSSEVDFNTIDGVMNVGAHAMSGTLNAFLDHTQSSLTWHDYIVNGRKSGELAQSAIFFGTFDVPCVMVSGDEAACVEAKQFFGDIECAVVKYAVGRNNAKSIDLNEAADKIYTAAKNSMDLIDKIKPYKPIMPMEIIVEFNRSDYCDMRKDNPDIERIDARTVRKVVREIKNYIDILV